MAPVKLPLLSLLLFPAGLAAQQPTFAAAADTVFQRWNSTRSPGCAVGVARGGNVLLQRGYGMADLERGVPLTAETILESGSVAKQFTATAVLLLASDGKLGLDDPARKYIPELPDYGRPLTIRHLLTHTSGLREWSSLVQAQGWPRGERAHTQADLLDIVVRQKALNYPVGDYYSYTNSGYALAETIVERVSGMSFQEFTRQRIFQPLGMTHTQWRDDFTRLVPGRGQAYSNEPDGWHLNMPFEDVVGPGGLLTTVGDWLIWSQAIVDKKLGAAWADSLTNRMRLTSGREIEYAKGLFITRYRGLREISHSGSTAGYSTFLARYPERDNLTIAVMCNAANAPAASHAHQLADRLITDFPAAPTLDTTRVDSAAFARYAGVYRNERTHVSQQLGVADRSRLRALPDGWYGLASGARWHFDLGPAGTPTRLRIAQPDGDTLVLAYVAPKPWTPTPQDLAAFVGRYRSDEVGTTFDVRVERDTLVVSNRPGKTVKLTPTYTDAFSLGGGGTAVWFTRERGRVTAMHFGESRVWDLVVRKLSS
jgi:CubicO group peptidase (beta-lactamase class C family)